MCTEVHEKTLCKQHIPRTATMTTLRTLSFEHKTHLIDLLTTGTIIPLYVIQLALVIQDLAKSLVASTVSLLLFLCCLRTKELISQSYSLVLMSYCITVQVTQSIHQLIHALIMCFYSNSLLLSLLTQITYSPSLVCVLPLLSVCALSANVSLAFVLFVSF